MCCGRVYLFEQVDETGAKEEGGIFVSSDRYFHGVQTRATAKAASDVGSIDPAPRVQVCAPFGSARAPPPSKLCM